MRVARSLLLLLLCCSLDFGQISKDSSALENPAPQTVDRYLLAIRNGDPDAALSLVRPTGVRFSAGGTRLGGLPPRPSSRDRSKISYFVRQVEILRPDVALAIGLWRDTNPGAVHRSGAFSYTMVQEGGVWKVATVHETLGQPIPSLDVSPAKSLSPGTRNGRLFSTAKIRIIG